MPFSLHIPHPGLSAKELAALHRKYIRERKPAQKELLFRSHFGLAVRMARRSTSVHFSLDEALSAACHGMMEALDRYNPRKGAFSTFSFWWMLKFVTKEKAFAKNVVALPYSEVRKSRKIRHLRRKHGCNDADLAKELGCTLEQLQHLEDLHVRSVSFPLSFRFDKYAEHETAGEMDQEREEQERIHRAKQALLECALDSLTPRERDVVRARHHVPPRTFHEIGAGLQMTREGARKLYLHAMDKLKRHTHGSRLD
jgi:RNA polymerase primary sigma factor